MSYLPDPPTPAAWELESIEPLFRSTAHSLREIVRNRGAHRWKLKASYPPGRRETLAPLYAFLMGLRGGADTFQVIPGPLANARGAVGSASVQVNANAAAGAQAAQFKGLPISTTGVLLAGDLFVISAAGPKVYMLTADASSDGAGVAAVSFRPQLFTGIATNQAVTVQQVPFTVRYFGDPIALRSGLGSLVDFGELAMIEAI